MEGMGLPGYQLPPGFRFHPTDQELIVHYLNKKVTSSLPPASSIIADIDLYKYNPWDLPAKAFFGEGEWFFFSPRERKYPNGARPNRAAGSGYWKATGTDKPILAAGSSQCLGVKKALVFYKGRPPKGTKTHWVMQEYRLLDSNPSLPRNKGSMRLDDWVLCRVRQKSILPHLPEDEHLSSNPSCNITNNDANNKGMKRNRSGFFEGTDYQLFAYLLGSQGEGNNLYEHSNPSSTVTCSNETATFGANEAKPLNQVLESIKRKLSFGALDELLMSQPDKRFNCYTSAFEQLSPTGSDSVDQDFPDFLI